MILVCIDVGIDGLVSLLRAAHDRQVKLVVWAASAVGPYLWLKHIEEP